MGMFSIEHGQAAYRADFAFYGAAVVLLAAALAAIGPREHGLLIGALGFLPALALGGPSKACTLTLGLVVGYLAYGVTHHATHHWRADGAWLRRRKRWHALHHHRKTPCCYGVTTTFRDHLFGSLPRAAS